MAKYALTPAGVVSKMSELYALSDPALAAEAAAIRTDFKGWMDDNFTMTGPQATYLAGMAERVTDYYGDICSMAFLGRCDIDFVHPTPPPVWVGKWVESEDAPKAKTNAAGDIEITGSITFTVEYIV